MTQHDDITVIIQGPLNAVSLSNIPNYQKTVKNIVISCWESCDISVIDNKIAYDTSVLLATSNSLDYIDSNGKLYYNNSNIAFQAATTLSGLHQVKTKYVIKTRSDEIYSDISYFAEVVKKNDKKLTTNNVLFQKDSVAKLHPSDHVIGGTTHNMLGAFEKVKNYCKKNTREKTKEKIPLIGKDIGVAELTEVAPETLICVSFLQHKGVEIDTSKSKEIMIENFNMVKASEMGRYLLMIKGQPIMKRPKDENQLIPGIGYLEENVENWVCPIASLKEL